MSRRMKRFEATLAAALLTFVLSACGGESEQAGTTATSGDQTATTTAGDTTSTWITGEQRPPIAVTEAGQTVLVSIDDNNIGMPTTVVPGPVVFTVTNAGTKQHDFQVEAANMPLKKLENALEPKGTASLQVDMPAGTYTVICPIEGHVEAGEKVTVTAENK